MAINKLYVTAGLTADDDVTVGANKFYVTAGLTASTMLNKYFKCEASGTSFLTAILKYRTLYPKLQESKHILLYDDKQRIFLNDTSRRILS